MTGTGSALRPFKPEHFLPHIQGLRAIAVLLVVVFHFWPGRLSGGYIGVDVFFVISGFLITGHLARELRDSSRINLPNFWAKRIRRLIPAALIVLIFSALAAAFLMPLSFVPSSLSDISTSMLYVENWKLAISSADYLHNIDGSIAQHYWSLSIEEQFYVVWPLVLLGTFALASKFAIARRWAYLVVTVAVLSVLSLIASVFYTQTNPSQAYFVLFTRVFEFGAGAILALMPSLRPRSHWFSNILGVLGVAILLVAGYKFTESTPFPSYWALVPVVGTALILVLKPGGSRWNVNRLLSLWPMRFLGDISYSLYLWHWPLIFIAPFVIGWGLSPLNRIILFVGCFVLAWLTKRFAEDPLRQLRALTTRKPRYTFGWMFVSFGVVAVLLLSIFGVQWPKYQQAQTQLAEIQAHPPACFGAEIATGCSNPALNTQIIPDPGFGNADEPSNPICFVQLTNSALHPCSFGSPKPDAPRVALVGDSHAYQLLNTFIAMANKNGWALTTYFKGACPWTTAKFAGSDPGFTAACQTYRDNLAAELPKQKFDVIFTTAYRNTEYAGADTLAAATAGFVTAWTTQNGGAQVIALADNPDMMADPNKCLRSLNSHSGASNTSAECRVAREEALAVPDAVIPASSKANIPLVDFTDVYCDSSSCAAVIGGADVYRDDNHLTVTFANSLTFGLEPAIRSALSQ